MSNTLTGRQRSEAKRQIVITNPSVCYYCKSTGLTEADNFCPNCGFPQKGTQSQMKRFLWLIRNKENLLDDKKKAVNKARNILFVLAGIFAVFGALFSLVMNQDVSVMVLNFIIAAIYLALGFWSRKSPLPCILIGFALYVIVIAINAVIDPVTLIQGLLMKVVVISALVYGYKGAKDSEEMEKELASISKAKNLVVQDE
jgi:hypothetical protein